MQQIAHTRIGEPPAPETTRPSWRRFTAAAASTFIAVAAAFGVASPAVAHDELVGIAGELNEDQTRITLTLSFNNEVMDVGAEAVVTGADGADLADGEPAISGRDVTQSIIMPGFDETITMAWRVVSSDGHPISNILAFAVLERSGGTEVEFRDVEAADESQQGEDHDHADNHDHADHDHADHDHDSHTDAAVNDQNQAIESGVPVGGWVAIAAGAVLIVGIFWWIIAKRRR